LCGDSASAWPGVASSDAAAAVAAAARIWLLLSALLTIRGDLPSPRWPARTAPPTAPPSPANYDGLMMMTMMMMLLINYGRPGPPT